MTSDVHPNPTTAFREIGVVAATDWFACYYEDGGYRFEPVAYFLVIDSPAKRLAKRGYPGLGFDANEGLLGFGPIEDDPNFVGYAHATQFNETKTVLKREAFERLEDYRDAAGIGGGPRLYKSNIYKEH